MSEGSGESSLSSDDILSTKLSRRRLLHIGAGAFATAATGGAAAVLRGSHGQDHSGLTPTPPDAESSTSLVDTTTNPSGGTESSVVSEATSSNPSENGSHSKTKETQSDDPVTGSAEKVDKKDVPEVKIIEGLETYGDHHALTQDQLNALVAYLNEEPLKKDKGMLYTTQYVTHETYARFKKGNYGETYQAFITRHIGALNDVLANTKANGGVKDQTQVTLRRLIVINGDVQVPDLYCPKEEIKDTDGCWLVKEYDPPSAGYWDSTERIDWGLNHEIGHSTLHLTDLYHMITPKDQLILPSELSDVPEQHQQYDIDIRNDYGQELMSGCAHRIGPYDSMRLQQRINKGKEHHTIADLVYGQDGGAYIADTGGYPSDIPERSYFRLGKQLANADLEFYRRVGVGQDSFTLELMHTASANGNGTAHIDKADFPIPENGVMQGDETVYLLKVVDPGGKKYYRWMDIRDFNMAFWSGQETEASFFLKLFSDRSLPDEVDWKIHHAPPEHWTTIDKGIEAKSHVIDGVPTFGLDKPYTLEGLDGLVEAFNVEKAPLDDKTVYVTAMLEKNYYEGFKKVSSESVQSFLARHAAAYQDLLREGNDGVKPINIALRRLIIVEDGFGDNNDSMGKTQQMTTELVDSDAVWNLYASPADELDTSFGYNAATKVSGELLEDMQSTILALPNIFVGFDAKSPNDEWRSDLESVPAAWRYYYHFLRSDGSDLYTDSPRIGRYEKLYLRRLIEQGSLHTKNMLLTGDTIPYQAPQSVEMSFQASTGEIFDHAAVQFYHSALINEGDSWSHEKLVKVDGHFMTGDDGKIAFSPDQLFPKVEGGMITQERGSIFARIRARNGQEYYRWLDATDFANSVLLGKEKRVSMQVTVGTPDEDPEAIDSAISYS